MRPIAGAAVWAATILLCGCGYVGEPLPPLLRIPVRVQDLTAVERGDRIIVQLTVPQLTTEGTVLREAPELDLRIGEPPNPWNADVWAGQAKRVPAGAVEKGRARYEIPVGGWEGKHVFIGARAIGPSGRDSGWSNFADFLAAPPLAPPAQVRAEATEGGVRLTWQGSAPVYRVYRQGPGEDAPAAVGDTQRPEWTDAQAVFGKTYSYSVKALSAADARAAESENSPPVTIAPTDKFPPKPPAGLTAAASPGNIALVWDRNQEPDFGSYRVYRAEGSGALKPVGDTGVTPSFGDRAVEAGKQYRYAVSAVDTAGNESQPCAPVEVTAQ